MSEANKELVRRYTREVFDECDGTALDRYLAPDFQNHVTGRRGLDDFRRLVEELRADPQRRNEIDLLVAEGDLVVALMTLTRTQGRFRHAHVYRIADGRIAEQWAVREPLSR